VTAGSQGEARIFPVEASAASAARSTPTRDPHAIAPPALELTVAGERLRVSGPGFVQGNALLWDRLALEVRERCLGPRSEWAPARFLELYAGIGFLTLPLARAGTRGVAVESDRQAVADLAFNLERAGLTGAVTAVSSRIEERSELAHWLAEADLLLVDPPRVGLEPRVREAIARGGPARVVYVSCDPATLARDLKELVGAGYRLASVVAFDLFPQTPHVETIVRLERRPA
jgi:23S rRNA (uracil1939-C5)-methyltransferase